MKRLLAPLSIVNQVALLMLLLGVLGVGGMSISAWMSQGIQGNAHAINKAGSLRMQSYRLLAQVPLAANSELLLQGLDKDENSQDLQHTVTQEGLNAEYQALRGYWQQVLQPRLREAQRPADAAPQVAHFVELLDKLVSDIDHQTERRLLMVTLVQGIFITLMLVLLVGTVIYLRRRLLQPWRQLVAMAAAVGHGDFSRRFTGRQHRDEMTSLGEALNTMANELSTMYGELEQRVLSKTADLQQKNLVLDFLYRTSRSLHTNEPLSSRLEALLSELERIVPFCAVQMRLYENNNQASFVQLSSPASKRDNCWSGALTPLHCPLKDKLGRYGVLIAQPLENVPLSADHRQLLNTLAEQLTSVLAIERQVDQQQRLILMEERATIARELHDSIAQSLSCLKIQASCLQMQGEELPPASRNLVDQMREELNVAYRQLRELLTTFRLRLTEPGLLAALQSTVKEFNQRLGLEIALDYQPGPYSLPPHQAIHVLQIAREALNNIHKHANASEVRIQVIAREGEVALSICDNGRGLPATAERPDHHGLIIMRDRARSLHGRCDILPRDGGGTEVRVIFRPDISATDHPEHPDE
ncbi:nitrate/nitrite two-component system sensor histidine kinase NarX [Paramixta manurensis]|uniref:Sensor protein n=1 Tax=Paramixta manurensis TaxID=2740817 RepID=A0A6M8UF06_9GAMM|nr:nitrate/nitrite two-component system sensor histidine kinase NarX [Erwiniaceae bacterium PD-1]